MLLPQPSGKNDVNDDVSNVMLLEISSRAGSYVEIEVIEII